MSINSFARKLLGKPDFNIDKRIPLGYLFTIGRIYLFGLVRGSFRKLFMKNVGKKLFIGSKVRILNKSKICIGNNVRIENNTTINALSEEGVFLGDRVKIGEYSKMLCTGSLSNLGRGISIGNDSSFSEYTFFGCAGGISIGNNVIAGQNVRFHAENHLYRNKSELIRKQGVSRKGIVVGDNCWIGSGVTILDGTKIGNNTVIAAGAVVSGEYEDNCILGGIPARMIGEI